ncbi:MAG: hypothetical protein ACE5FB_05065, partial [Candidatus Binatia bacterium]
SAEAAGDRYRTFPSLTANGIGSVVASLFGSCFPTTIYIGHPGWKRLGARSGYSALNGVFISLLCITGTIQGVLAIIPLEAGIGILLYIGIIIVAQAFQETPEGHAPAVALGLFPAMAAWGLLMVETGLRAGGKSLPEVGLDSFAGSLAIHGMISAVLSLPRLSLLRSVSFLSRNNIFVQPSGLWPRRSWQRWALFMPMT